MKKELELALVKKYPIIFREYNLTPFQSCLGRGFEHRDGWYDVIDKFCNSIQFHIEHNCIPQIICVQCKEKMGRLTFYWQFEDLETFTVDKESYEFVRGLVSGMSLAASMVCEKCGSNVCVTKDDRPNGRIQSLCSKCWTNVDLDIATGE